MVAEFEKGLAALGGLPWYLAVERYTHCASMPEPDDALSAAYWPLEPSSSKAAVKSFRKPPFLTSASTPLLYAVTSGAKVALLTEGSAPETRLREFKVITFSMLAEFLSSVSSGAGKILWTALA